MLYRLIASSKNDLLQILVSTWMMSSIDFPESVSEPCSLLCEPYPNQNIRPSGRMWKPYLPPTKNRPSRNWFPT